MSAGPLQEVERLLVETEDADDVLRGTVSAIASQPGVVWAGIAFAEESGMLLGPSEGLADETRRTRQPIVFQGALVGELWVDGDVDRGLVEGVATRIAAHVLIGWDTAGEAWDP